MTDADKVRSNTLWCLFAFVPVFGFTWIAMIIAKTSANLALIMIVAVLLIVWSGFRHRLETPLLSPVFLTLIGLAAVGSLGHIFGQGMEGITGNGVIIFLDNDVRQSTVWLFAITMLCTAFGAVFAASIKKNVSDTTLRDAIADSRAPSMLIMVASIIPLLLVSAEVGGRIFERSQYLVVPAGSNLAAVGQQAGLGGVAILGYIYGRSTVGRRILAFLLVLAYTGLYFSLASRRLALVPIAFALGYVASRARGGRTVVVVGALLAAALLPLPLFLRSQFDHGLFPYLSALRNFSFTNVDWRKTVYNVLIAYPVSAETAFVVNPIPHSTFWVEVNPIPGQSAGWYDVSDTLRLNAATPYSAVGELGNYGMSFLIPTWFAIGAVLAYFDGRVSYYLRTRHAAFAMGIVGLAGLFAVQILQYNLRNCIRVLIYAIVLDVVARIVGYRGRKRAPISMPAVRSQAKSRQTVLATNADFRTTG